MNKRILSTLITFTMIISQLYISPLTIFATTSGTCGNNVTWSYNSNGNVLTISGTGAMTDFTSTSSRPWNSIADDVEELIINEGVTSIGNNAFMDFHGLWQVDFADTIKRIGDNAFAITDSSIDMGEFFIMYDNLPASLEYIGNHAFQQMSLYPDDQSGKVILPTTVTYIGEAAFIINDYITSINIPKSVTYLGKSVFSNCSNLVSVDFQASVSEMPEGCFSYCGSGYGDLDMIETPGLDITIPSNVTSIADWAFGGVTMKDNTITIPETVTSIGNKSLAIAEDKSISNDDNKRVYYIYNKNLPLSTEYLNPGVIYGYNGSTSEEFCNENSSKWTFKSLNTESDSISTNEDENIITGSWSDTIQYSYDKTTKTITVSGGPLMPDANSASSLTIPGISIEEPKTLVLEDSVHVIGKYNFKNYIGLTKVVLPDTFAKIGNHAFEGCTGLTEIKLPKDFGSILSYAFSDCTNLNKINLPEGLYQIGKYAFSNCTHLKDLIIPDDMLYLDENAFKNVSPDLNIQLPHCSAYKDLDDKLTLNTEGIVTIPILEDGKDIQMSSNSIYGEIGTLRIPINYLYSSTYDYIRANETIRASVNKIILYGDYSDKCIDFIRTPGSNSAYCKTSNPLGNITPIGDGYDVEVEDSASILGSYALSTLVSNATYFGVKCKTRTLTFGPKFKSLHNGFMAPVDTDRIVINAIKVYNPNLVFGSTALPTSSPGIVYGYSGSTAEAAAVSAGWTFQALDGTPVEGTALDSKGNTISGELFIDRTNAIGTSQNDFIEVDSKGNWSYGAIPNGTWKFVLYKDGEKLATTSSIKVNNGIVEGDTNFIIEAQEKTYTISGTVRDKNSHLLKNVPVSFDEYSTSTDVNGNYTIENIPEGTLSTVIAKLDSKEAKGTEHSITSNETIDLTFNNMFKQFNLQLKDKDNNPAKNAEVTLDGKTPSYTTDNSGNILTEYYVDKDYDLTIVYNGKTYNANTADNPIVLGDKYNLSGTVVNKSNNPVSNLTLKIGDNITTPIQDGQYDLSSVWEGTYPVKVVNLYNQVLFNDTYTLDDNSTYDIKLDYDLTDIKGTLTDASNNPINGAEVSIPEVGTETTDKDGNYNFPNIINNVYNITIIYNGDTFTTTTGTPSIQLVKTYKVTGAVKDSQGNPVNGATVTCGSKTATTNNNGEFELTDVPSGTYKIQVIKDNLTGSGVVTVTNTDSICDDITVTPQDDPSTNTGHKISGDITNSQGNPVAFAPVKVGDKTTATDENGHFEIIINTTDTVTVTCTINGVTASKDIDVTQDTTCDLQLPEGEVFTVTGKVLDCNNTPINGAQVSVKKDSSVLTDDNGEFELSNVESGSQVITVSHNNITYTNTISVNNSIDININMPYPIPTIILGTVKDTETNGIGEVEVSIIKQPNDTSNEPVKSIITDNEGNYELTDITPGKYEIITKLDDKHSYTTEIIITQVNDDQPVISGDTNISITDKIGSIIGSVVDINGDPIEGANVEIFGKHTETNENGIYSFDKIIQDTDSAITVTLNEITYSDTVNLISGVVPVITLPVDTSGNSGDEGNIEDTSDDSSSNIGEENKPDSEDSSNKPEDSSNKPEDSSNKPEDSSNKPEDSSNQPGSEDNSGSENSSSNQPGSEDSSKPEDSSSSNQPGSEDSSSNKPEDSSSTNKPDSGEDFTIESTTEVTTTSSVSHSSGSSKGSGKSSSKASKSKTSSKEDNNSKEDNTSNKEDNFSIKEDLLKDYSDKDTLTRADVAKILYAHNITSKVNKYSDVSSNKWYKDYITNTPFIGYGDDTVRAEQLITRAEFTTLLVRIKFGDDKKDTLVQNIFSDVNADTWYAGTIQFAYDNKLINGYPDGTFKPNNNITYKECITILTNVLNMK